MTVFLVAGPPAVGKSTVARLVAESRSRSLLVDVDRIRDSFVVSGRVLPSAEWSPALVDQLAAARESACGLARAYARIGFDVVIDDFLDPHSLLDEYDPLADLAPVRVLLLPGLDTAKARNRARSGGVDYIDAGIDLTYAALPDIEDLRTRGWTVLDNGSEDPASTRDRVLSLTARASARDHALPVPPRRTHA